MGAHLPRPESAESVNEFFSKHICNEEKQETQSLAGLALGRYRLTPRILGQGRHGAVREAVDCKCGVSYAVKSLGKAKAMDGCFFDSEVAAAFFAREASMNDLVSVVAADQTHVVYELASSDLLQELHTLRSHGKQGMEESQVKQIVKCVLRGLSQLHCRDLAHCDVKPENCLLMPSKAGLEKGKSSTEWKAKLADLEWITKNGTRRRFAGSAGYVAPEMLEESQNSHDGTVLCTYKNDIWSLGVLTYCALVLANPFAGGTLEFRLDRAKLGPSFVEAAWSSVSEEARNFVEYVLQTDPVARPTAAEALQHEWLISTSLPTSLGPLP